MHRGVAADDLRLPGQMLRGVGCGIQVRHRADGRIAAACGCGRTHSDGLLLRESRLAQVDMYVHESRHEPTPAEADDAVVGTPLADRDDASLFDGDFARFEAAAAEDPCVGVNGSHPLRRKKIGQPKQLP